MNNEQILLPVFKQLYNKLQNNEIINGTVELIGINIQGLDPLQSVLDFKVKKTNEEYCKKELDWYLSQDLNVYPQMQDIQIWKQVADKGGYINSNYGWCIFHHDNYNQYDNCLNTLKRDKNTRQALMIYTRPSIHYDWNENGAHDFICTVNVQCFIRNNKLIYLVNQRSCDAIFGFFNDFYWHCFVYNKLYLELKQICTDLQQGNIDFYIGSFHVYERHFNLLREIYEQMA
jgi:thymidylate synthase